MLYLTCEIASQLQMAYIAVYLLIKRPFISMGIGSGSTVKMPVECQDAIKLSVDLFDVMRITDLLCNWSLGSKLSASGNRRRERKTEMYFYVVNSSNDI